MMSGDLPRAAAALSLAIGLVACVPNPGILEPIDNSQGGRCDAAPVQSYVGDAALQAKGGMILVESGARTLRWGAPDSAWTMDYREDRVNVRYDADMTITEITCG